MKNSNNSLSVKVTDVMNQEFGFTGNVIETKVKEGVNFWLIKGVERTVEVPVKSCLIDGLL